MCCTRLQNRHLVLHTFAAFTGRNISQAHDGQKLPLEYCLINLEQPLSMKLLGILHIICKIGGWLQRVDLCF